MPAVVGKDSIFTFGTFAEVKALTNLFAAGHVCCSVSGGGIGFDWWAQACCNRYPVVKGLAGTGSPRQIIPCAEVRSHIARCGVRLSQGPHINVFLWGVSSHCAVPGGRGDHIQ